VRLATERLLDPLKEELGRQKPSIDRLNRSLVWLERDGQLRFEDQRIRTATALLSPFIDRSPAPDIQNAIQTFLLRTIGDPRSKRPRWQGVPESVRNVLFRWLVRMSLEDFFQILDATAQDSHWKFRKAFWTAYLQHDVITDAWIVLGPEAGRLLRREFEDGTGAGKLKTGTGVLPTHSVLLMRIGNLTIAEWSHNGKCRAWLEGSPGAPKFYEPSYSRSQLAPPVRRTGSTRNGPRWEQSHIASERGIWQGTIANHIADETGIRIPRTEYMPRRKR
jgi:hypothetical protein